MQNNPLTRIHSALRDLPDSTILVNPCPHSDSLPLPKEKLIDFRCAGKGRIDLFEVFPGITLSLNQFLADQIILHPISMLDILEISHCRSGKITWTVNHDTSFSLGEGDSFLLNNGYRKDLTMKLPSGYYEGISIYIDLKKVRKNLPPVLQDTFQNSKRLQYWFPSSKTPVMIPSGPETDCIFHPLYDLPVDLRMPYFKLKVQELFLYLYRFSLDTDRQYTHPLPQTALMKQIHQQLTSHLERRYTIEELSRQYLINTSTLKETFKAVYGMPIATYMNGYRMRKAMELLLKTDNSIAEIAADVGYETQGKFTKAFKKFTQMTPSSYRKNYRTSNPFFFRLD